MCRTFPKTTTSACKQLSIKALRGLHWLQSGIILSRSLTWPTNQHGRPVSIHCTLDTLGEDFGSLRLQYNLVTETKRFIDYTIRLETTRLVSGGLRWWFVCPFQYSTGSPCARRVSILHLPPSLAYFGCRHCHNLTYVSCQESGQHRSLYNRLAASLGTDSKTIHRILNRK